MKSFGGFKRKISVFLLLLTAVFHIFPTSAWANSAMKEWSGTDASGVLVTDKYCPVTVKHEKLVFDIPMFPDFYYSDASQLTEYRASVTARYEFYNPKDYDVTATLAFPFGVFPEYVYADTDDFYTSVTTQRYGVKLNGEAAEVVLRHTYFDKYSENFDIAEQLSRLRDGYSADPLCSPDTVVTGYHYKVTNTEDECYAVIKISGIGENRLIVADHEYQSSYKDGMEIGFFIDENEGQDGFTVWCIGAPLDDTVNPQLINNSIYNKTASGTVAVKTVETMTLREFALLKHDNEGGISETDWYNAVVDSIKVNWTEDGIIPHEVWTLEPTSYLMRWYTYEMTVPAGGTMINEVVAPLYPDIDGGYEPPIYQYTYLLSPAGSWAGFGKLDIEIITPYYLIECDVFPKFEKTESGYATSLNGLPSGELRFTLSADPDPQREITPYTILGIGLYVAIIGVTVVLPAAAIITVTVIVVKKRRRMR